MENEKLKYTTITIQLSNDMGLPYDMPDDWLETVLSIVGMLNKKYDCGMDVAYGLASREGFNIIDKEVIN